MDSSEFPSGIFFFRRISSEIPGLLDLHDLLDISVNNSDKTFEQNWLICVVKATLANFSYCWHNWCTQFIRPFFIVKPLQVISLSPLYGTCKRRHTCADDRLLASFPMFVRLNRCCASSCRFYGKGMDSQGCFDWLELCPPTADRRRTITIDRTSTVRNLILKVKWACR